MNKKDFQRFSRFSMAARTHHRLASENAKEEDDILFYAYILYDFIVSINNFSTQVTLLNTFSHTKITRHKTKKNVNSTSFTTLHVKTKGSDLWDWSKHPERSSRRKRVQQRSAPNTMNNFLERSSDEHAPSLQSCIIQVTVAIRCGPPCRYWRSSWIRDSRNTWKNVQGQKVKVYGHAATAGTLQSSTVLQYYSSLWRKVRI